jgi:hypothetical protein
MLEIGRPRFGRPWLGLSVLEPNAVIGYGQEYVSV